MDEAIQEGRGLLDVELGDFFRGSIEQVQEADGNRISIVVQQGGNGHMEFRGFQDGFGIFIFRLEKPHSRKKVVKSRIFPQFLQHDVHVLPMLL